MFITLQQLELHSVPFSVDVPAGQIDYDGKVTQSGALHAEGVAELLGHSGTAMLHKHYAHLTARAKALRSALAQIR